MCHVGVVVVLVLPTRARGGGGTRLNNKKGPDNILLDEVCQMIDLADPQHLGPPCGVERFKGVSDCVWGHFLLFLDVYDIAHLTRTCRGLATFPWRLVSKLGIPVDMPLCTLLWIRRATKDAKLVEMTFLNCDPGRNLDWGLVATLVMPHQATLRSLQLPGLGFFWEHKKNNSVGFALQLMEDSLRHRIAGERGPRDTRPGPNDAEGGSPLPGGSERGCIQPPRYGAGSKRLKTVHLSGAT